MKQKDYFGKSVIRKAALFLWVAISFASCSNNGDVVLKEKFLKEMLRCKEVGTVFCVSKVTAFDWDRLYMIDGQNDGWRQEQVSGQICGDGFSIPAHEKYIFFLVGRDIVRHFVLNDNTEPEFHIGACEEPPLFGCLNDYCSPESACFEIRKEADEYGYGQGLILVPRNQ